MLFRVGGVDDFNTVDALGLIAFSVFFQGCKRNCIGCHNPDLQNFEGGQEMDTIDIKERIWRNQDYYEAVVMVGGEPLEQVEALKDLLEFVKGTSIQAWLYTGFNRIPKEIAALCDVIVAGEYRQDLRTGGFPASSNQRVIRRAGFENICDI